MLIHQVRTSIGTRFDSLALHPTTTMQCSGVTQSASSRWRYRRIMKANRQICQDYKAHNLRAGALGLKQCASYSKTLLRSRLQHRESSCYDEPNGRLAAAYVEDQIKLTSWLRWMAAFGRRIIREMWWRMRAARGLALRCVFPN